MWWKNKKGISTLVLILCVGLISALAVGQVYDRSETLYVSGAAWGPASTWNPFQP